MGTCHAILHACWVLVLFIIIIDYCRIYINRSSYNNCNIQHLIVYNNYMYILVIKSYNNFYFES